MLKNVKTIIYASFLTMALSPSIQAQDLTQPEGQIILTVTGKLDHMNMEDGSAAFDLEMLKEFEPVTYSTTTIWTEGEHEYTGVLLKDLYDYLGVDGGEIQAHALDDYTVELPYEDAVENGAILAYWDDGEEISIREKGPIWVMYPFDDNPDYQSEVYYARSIWQLAILEIIE